MTRDSNATSWPRKVSRTREYDVVVAGGGAAGVAAAVTAASAGARTLLVESYPVLGGAATISGVAHFQIGPDVQGMPIIRGHYSNVLRDLDEMGALRGRNFLGEALKVVYLNQLEQAGADVLLHATVTDVEMEQETIRAVAVETVAGLESIRAKVFIDASGDGDLGAMAGAPVESGRPGDARKQPLTLYVTLSGVDAAIATREDANDWYKVFERELPHIDTAQVRLAYGPRFSVTPEGRFQFSMMHIRDTDASDSEQLTNAELRARRQSLEIWQFFRTHIPGFQNSVLDNTPAQIGIRETRRILGEYVIDRDHILGCRKTSDTVGRSNSFIDVHNVEGEGTLHEYLPRDEWYDIPYRALISRGVTNLFAAGRCVSCTHWALGSLREQPTCMVTGQGAGAGAAVSALSGVDIRQIPIESLQSELVRQGADLGPGFDQQFEPAPWFSSETGPKYGQPTPGVVLSGEVKP